MHLFQNSQKGKLFIGLYHFQHIQHRYKKGRWEYIRQSTVFHRPHLSSFQEQTIGWDRVRKNEQKLKILCFTSKNKKKLFDPKLRTSLPNTIRIIGICKRIGAQKPSNILPVVNDSLAVHSVSSLIVSGNLLVSYGIVEKIVFLKLVDSGVIFIIFSELTMG